MLRSGRRTGADRRAVHAGPWVWGKHTQIAVIDAETGEHRLLTESLDRQLRPVPRASPADVGRRSHRVRSRGRRQRPPVRGAARTARPTPSRSRRHARGQRLRRQGRHARARHRHADDVRRPLRRRHARDRRDEGLPGARPRARALHRDARRTAPRSRRGSCGRPTSRRASATRCCSTSTAVRSRSTAPSFFDEFQVYAGAGLRRRVHEPARVLGLQRGLGTRDPRAAERRRARLGHASTTRT